MSDSLNLSAPPVAPAAMQVPPEVAAIIESQRRQIAESQQREVDARVKSTLTSALAAHADRFVSPEALAHAESLLRSRIRLAESNGQSVVCGPELQPVSQFVAETLAKEMPDMLKPQSHGGTAAGQPSQVGAATPGHRYSPEPQAPEAMHVPPGATQAVMKGAPRPPGWTLSDVMLGEVRSARSAQQAPAGSDPGRNPSMPFGLGPKK